MVRKRSDYIQHQKQQSKNVLSKVSFTIHKELSGGYSLTHDALQRIVGGTSGERGCGGCGNGIDMNCGGAIML